MGIIVPRANMMAGVPALFVLGGFALTRSPRLTLLRLQSCSGHHRPEHIGQLAGSLLYKRLNDADCSGPAPRGTLPPTSGKCCNDDSALSSNGASNGPPNHTSRTCQHLRRNPPVENSVHYYSSH